MVNRARSRLVSFNCPDGKPGRKDIRDAAGAAARPAERVLRSDGELGCETSRYLAPNLVGDTGVSPQGQQEQASSIRQPGGTAHQLQRFRRCGGLFRLEGPIQLTAGLVGYPNLNGNEALIPTVALPAVRVTIDAPAWSGEPVSVPLYHCVSYWPVGSTNSTWYAPGGTLSNS